MRRSRCRRARRRGRTGSGCARARAAAARRRRARGCTGVIERAPHVEDARDRGPCPDGEVGGPFEFRCLAHRAVTSAGLVGGVADHQGADPLCGAGCIVDSPDEAPARDHGDLVADLEQLVEVGRDHQRGASRAGELADRIAHRVRRAQVEPVGGLVEHDDARVERQLAREQQLLDVAARQRAGARRQARRADVVLADEIGRNALDRVALDPPEPPERMLADALQEQVDVDRACPARFPRRDGRR